MPLGVAYSDELHTPLHPLGRRIQTTRAGVTTYHFHSVRWQVIEDRIRPAGNTTAIKDLPVAAQYVWSPHYVDELILIDRDLNADGDLSDAGERLYVQQDANYNVTSVVSDTLTSGEGSEGFQPGVVERYQYDPYGQRTVLDANWAVDADGVSDVQMVHGHQGGQHDVESHLAHFRHRDLNVVLGRWTRQDPLGYVDGGSLYEYVRGGPTRWVDPWGLQRGHEQKMREMERHDTYGVGNFGAAANNAANLGGGAGVVQDGLDEFGNRIKDEATDPLNYAGGPALGLLGRLLKYCKRALGLGKSATGAAGAFSYSGKIGNDMANRGWTDELVTDTLSNPVHTSPAKNKATGTCATAFFRRDGSHVVRDDGTGEIIQVTKIGDPNWIPDSSIQNPYRP